MHAEGRTKGCPERRTTITWSVGGCAIIFTLDLVA